MICFSKALCAPVGSALCGDEEFIHRARRVRKQLGGGMRQAGVLAAAGIVALASMVDRLADDHARARSLADGLREIRGLSLEFGIPPTNMVYIQFTPQATINAPMLVEALAGKGIKVSSIGANRMRLVVHHWIDDQAVAYTIDSFRQALGCD